MSGAPEMAQFQAVAFEAGLGPAVEGPALVTTDGFSARYDLDPATGVISRRSHPLYGQSVVGTILVASFSKGGVATSWRLLDLVHRGTAPAGLLFGVVNPVMVQAAVFAELPIMHGAPAAAFASIKTGDLLRLFPDEKRIEVISA